MGNGQEARVWGKPCLRGTHCDELVSGLPVMDLQSGGRGGPQIPGEKSHRRESLAGVEEICLEEVDLFSDEGSTHLPTPSPTP